MAQGQRLRQRPKQTASLTLDMVRAQWHARSSSGETFATALHHTYQYVLAHFFGTEWLNDHVLIGCRFPGYLTMRPVAVGDGVGIDKNHTLRVHEVAELLYNLQSLRGFEHCLDRMFTGQIESTVAELAFGMFLRQQGIAFSYVSQSGVKTNDYDVHVHYRGGRMACGDIKCKIEGRDFAEKSLLSSLKKAQAQLPPDRPGIVFVKVPQQWFNLGTGKLGVETDVSELLVKFFRTTSRVVLVVFYAKVILDDPRGTAINHLVLERENPTSRFVQNGPWRLFKDAKKPSDWVDFGRMMTASSSD